MDNQKIGAEFSQLARLLFDAAASRWYAAVLIEIIAGILVAVLAISDLPDDLQLFGALFGLLLLVVGYILRLQFEDQYDTAETMRRQAVFSEALDWPIGRTQAAEWRQKVGKSIRDRAKVNIRPTDYYATQNPSGSKRLVEMTIESVFWTKHLYQKLHSLIWAATIFSICISIVVIFSALSTVIPESIDILIAKFLYTFIPTVVTINLLGWALRLNRVISAFRDIEISLERLVSEQSLDTSQAIRIVSEYNCQVASGFPIHNFLYKRWHNEIDELWSKR